MMPVSTSDTTPQRMLQTISMMMMPNGRSHLGLRHSSAAVETLSVSQVAQVQDAAAATRVMLPLQDIHTIDAPAAQAGLVARDAWEGSMHN
jgi:hypothetical protein